MRLVQLGGLKNEIDTDPLARGYAGMTDDELVTSLNTKDRDFWIELTSAQIYALIDLTELAAKSTAEQVRIDRILSLAGQIATAPGANARAEFISVFGGSSTTISNLATVANVPISRATELEIGQVKNRDLGRMRIEAAKGLI